VITIEESLYNKMPPRLQAMFQELPNLARDEVLALFPDTKGKNGMTQQASSRGLYEGGKSLGDTKVNDGISDSGSAARFFYCAKTSKKDRNEGLDGFEETYTKRDNGFSDKISDTKQARANIHPTVKPTDLMRYLVRLVTPPNGTVLDPFMGSGSTGKAAVLEGFDFIGIDMTPEYVEIARARIEFAMKNKDEDEQGTLF